MDEWQLADKSTFEEGLALYDDFDFDALAALVPIVKHPESFALAVRHLGAMLHTDLHNETGRPAAKAVDQIEAANKAAAALVEALDRLNPVATHWVEGEARAGWYSKHDRGEQPPWKSFSRLDIAHGILPDTHRDQSGRDWTRKFFVERTGYERELLQGTIRELAGLKQCLSEVSKLRAARPATNRLIVGTAVSFISLWHDLTGGVPASRKTTAKASKDGKSITDSLFREFIAAALEPPLVHHGLKVSFDEIAKKAINRWGSFPPVPGTN